MGRRRPRVGCLVAIFVLRRRITVVISISLVGSVFMILLDAVHVVAGRTVNIPPVIDFRPRVMALMKEWLKIVEKIISFYLRVVCHEKLLVVNRRLN